MHVNEAGKDYDKMFATQIHLPVESGFLAAAAGRASIFARNAERLEVSFPASPVAP
jgi:hypothetical protein